METERQVEDNHILRDQALQEPVQSPKKAKKVERNTSLRRVVLIKCAAEKELLRYADKRSKNLVTDMNHAREYECELRRFRCGATREIKKFPKHPRRIPLGTTRRKKINQVLAWLQYRPITKSLLGELEYYGVLPPDIAQSIEITDSPKLKQPMPAELKFLDNFKNREH